MELWLVVSVVARPQGSCLIWFPSPKQLSVWKTAVITLRFHVSALNLYKTFSSAFLCQSLAALFMSCNNIVSCFAIFVRYLSILVIAFSLLQLKVLYILLTKIPLPLYTGVHRTRNSCLNIQTTRKTSVTAPFRMLSEAVQCGTLPSHCRRSFLLALRSIFTDELYAISCALLMYQHSLDIFSF